jgi:copper chaperone CopZ
LTKTGKVKAVKVDAAQKKATFETTGEISDAEIKKAVQSAGYDAVKITRS